MKKLLIVLGILATFFVAVAILVPLAVDVDKYRPQIVDAANQQLNGKVELGKLKLSLWGQVRIEVAGLKVSDSNGREVVGVKDAYFHLPLMPLLTGAPTLTFKMNQPSLNVLKDRSGRLNLMSLVKKTPKSVAQSASASPPQSSGTNLSGGVPLPGIVTRASLGVELKNAQITYSDQSSGLSSVVKDLNLILKDISLSHPTELELWADLNTKLGTTLLLKGPLRLTAKAQPELLNGQLKNVSLTAKLDMDSVEMTAPGIFEKRKGMATSVELAVSASESDAKIEKFTAKFFNAEVTARGTVTHLASPPSSGPAGASVKAVSPVVHVLVNSNAIEFKPWVELIPMLKEFDLGGSAQVNAEVSGHSGKIGYRAQFLLNDLTAKAPQLKTQPRFDAKVIVATDQVESFLVTLKAPANDLKIQGKLISFAQPKLDVQVTSAGMDLDQLVIFPPSSSAAGAATQGKAGSESASSAPQSDAKTDAKTDKDLLFNPLRENQMLAAFVANVGIDIKMLKAQGIKISDIGCKMSFKNLTAGLDACGLKVFGGVFKSDFHLQIKPKAPVYQFAVQMNGLDIKQAVESQLALFKNTVTGKANFSIQGQGASLNSNAAVSNMKANGNFKVDQAAFATIDVMKMVGDAIAQAMNQIGNQIPAAKGKTLGAMPSGGSKYELISSDFSIQGGKFSAPNFFAKALPNQGIDIKGTTTVGLKDMSLNTAWDMIDTYNVTHLRDVSVNQNGVQVDHVFAEGNLPIHFPMHAGCTIQAPCYSSTEVPVALGKVALSNVATALTGRAKQEVKKQAESIIKQIVPPSLQNKLKSFF